MTTPAQDRQRTDCSVTYDFNFVQPPPDRLICKICQSLCSEAQKSECCGHVFCKSDLESMKAAPAVNYACPVCRVEPFKTHPDRAVDREIKELKIYCRNKEVGYGCSWSGELDQIDAHLNNCKIACEYCKEVMHHTAIVSHANECPCHCQYCDTVAERDVISGQHMKKCSKFPVPCPNACGKDKIPQDEIDSHKKECPLEMIRCEYYDIGCESMLMREKLAAHYRDEMSKHLQYMHKVVRQLQKEREDSDNTEAVAELSLLESTGQITTQQETKAKVREDIIGLNEKYHKMKSKAYTVAIILVSVLVLAFAVLVTHYEDKFTLVTDDVKLQNNQLDQVTNAIIEASAAMDTVKHYLISILHHVISGSKPSTMKLDILSELSGAVMLVRPIFKLPDYKEKIKTGENWTSSPFFAFDGGYQMCLKAYAAGIRQGAGSHISVELYLMKGPYDDKLQQSGHFPLKGNFSIHLPYQFQKEDYLITHKMQIGDHKDSHIGRVTHNGMVKVDDLSIDKFVSYKHLTNSRAFIGNDLYFQVQYDEAGQPTYKDIFTLSEQLEVQKLSLQLALKFLILNKSSEDVDDQVALVNIKLPGFSKMTIDSPWYSDPFFAFRGGYQMCLKVMRPKDCLLTLELFLMKGPYDEKLQKLGLWPLKGTFTAKLLGNDTYYPHTVLDEERCTKCFDRVTGTDVASEGFGFSLFTLDSSCTKPNFFKDDTLFFEVIYNVAAI